MSTREKLLLLVLLALAPALLALSTFTLSFRRAEQVRFCANCHTMTPWIADLENSNSVSLASKHYRDRLILHDQCYTCHVDYGFFGPIQTKLESLRHVFIYYTGIGMPHKIALYKPFPNVNCLQCHGHADSFRKNPAHVGVMKAIQANQLGCVTCHQPIHTPKG